MTGKRRHDVEQHINTIGLHKFKCSCGVSKQFTESADMRRFAWIHTRELPTERVSFRDVFDAVPQHRPTNRAKPGRKAGRTSMEPSRLGMY